MSEIMEIEESNETKTPMYEVGDTVLCFSRNELYTARLNQCEFDKDSNSYKYFIHYLKWSNKWDEWVDENVLFKRTPQNWKNRVELAKKIQAKLNKEEEEKKKKDSSDKKQNVAPTIQVDLKEHIAQDNLFDSTLSASMSFGLKAQMVEEYDMVISNHLWVPLPREPNIEKILSEFIESIDDTQTKIIESQIVKSIVDYFNMSLPLLLLYPNEKPQADSIMEKNKDKKFSEIYGAEHLLRLIMKLPQLVSLVSNNQSIMDVLFSNFLQEHLEYFVKPNDYISSINH